MTILYNKNSFIDLRRKLRKDSTLAEKRLWEVVRANKLGVKIKRQHSIDDYIVDFCAPRHKLIIEVDGSTHQDDLIQKRDKIRQKYLEDLGFKVIRFTNEEVLKDRDTVVINIKIALGMEAY